MYIFGKFSEPEVPAMAEQKKKKQKWILKRHKVVIEIARLIMRPYCRLIYGLKFPKNKDLIREQSLVLLNHVTPMDQFFVGLYFRDPLYYMATEDIFSNGWLSKLIKWAVNPVPIKKQTTDIKAVMNCIRIVREGGSICIAPEGNRTYHGRLVYINPAIVAMAKKLGLPIRLFRIDGGYGIEPRWADKPRKGSIDMTVSRVISPAEAKAMTDEELLQAIVSGLSCDENCLDREFRGKHLAEFVERMVYVCPECGLSRFESHGNTFHCTKCGRETELLPTKELRGVNWDCPYRFLGNWYDAQEAFVNALDTDAYLEQPLYRETCDVRKVILYKNKVPFMKNATVAIYGDRIELNDLVLPFEEISTVTVLGRNKLNIYHGGEVYQFKGHKRFNSLKYMNLFCRSKNLRGENNGKFLGL